MKPSKYGSRLIAVALALWALPQTLHAEVDLSSKTISDWTFSKAFSGTEPSEENIKGKVVVLEYWGVQ